MISNFYVLSVLAGTALAAPALKRSAENLEQLERRNLMGFVSTLVGNEGGAAATLVSNLVGAASTAVSQQSVAASVATSQFQDPTWVSEIL